VSAPRKPYSRRGPHRLRAATLPDGSEVLECGHAYTPDTRESASMRARTLRRRCPLCPYEGGERRAEYWRARYNAQKGRAA
jgi:hypothetical protein